MQITHCSFPPDLCCGRKTCIAGFAESMFFTDTSSRYKVEQIQPYDYTMTIVSVGIAVIIAVAVVGIALFFTLRKR